MVAVLVTVDVVIMGNVVVATAVWEMMMVLLTYSLSVTVVGMKDRTVVLLTTVTGWV